LTLSDVTSVSEVDAVAAVRRFSRFYTDVIGLLRGGLLGTPYSLTEARVLFELARPEPVDALALRRGLDLDAGYLSRILQRFEADGLVTRERSAADGRRQVIGLTAAGRAAFADLDARSAAQIEALLAGAGAAERARLVEALGAVESILSGHRPPGTYLLRPLEPGDLGWVVQRHGVRYADEYGWDATFEGLVAQIVGDYARSPHAARENAWIAEVDGRPVGCVFCMRRDDDVAQLRLLLVEPAARGAGIGSRLVDECLRFATRVGYREIMLWTNDVLVDARRIYEKAGFHLVHEAPRPNFGKDLVEQVWRRPLSRGDR
jgi:DNA-binding MarR family transcriptional regulator/GNAT superfamily N-acetyltransferase